MATDQEAIEKHELAQQLQAEGNHAEALLLFEPVAAHFRSADGDNSPDLANVLLDTADSLLAVCRYEEAERAAREAKDILVPLRSQLDADTWAALGPRALDLWGGTLRELGRYEEAAVPILEAIREAELAFGNDRPEIAGYLNNYGVLCKYWGKFDEGEQTYRRALAILEKEFGQESLETATLYHNLGGLEHTRGNFAKGEPLGRKAYEIRRRELGEDDPATIADLVAWAGLLDGLERFSESIPIYRRALAFYEEKYGPDHFEVAATLNNLGLAVADSGDQREGRALLERCVAIKRKLFGSDDHPEVRLSLSNLSKLA